MEAGGGQGASDIRYAQWRLVGAAGGRLARRLGAAYNNGQKVLRGAGIFVRFLQLNGRLYRSLEFISIVRDS